MVPPEAPDLEEIERPVKQDNRDGGLIGRATHIVSNPLMNLIPDLRRDTAKKREIQGERPMVVSARTLKWGGVASSFNMARKTSYVRWRLIHLAPQGQSFQ